MQFDFFGKRVSIINTNKTKNEETMLRESIEELIAYKNASMERKKKVVDNERWFRALHWDFFRSDNFKDMPEPTTNYLLSNILNKHADMMDAYPKANMLPREESDTKLAETLSSIVPLVYEQTKFKNVYSEAAYTKLKQGYCIYSPTWNDSLNGIGEHVLNEIDLLSIFWEPKIKNIQQSKSVYVAKLVDNDKLREILTKTNPELVDKIGGQGLINVDDYPTIDKIDTSNMTLVIDRYYKNNGKLHILKFIDGGIIDWTESAKYKKEGKYKNGFYDHGLYPIVIDRLIPEPQSVYGIGFIDIMKNPQMYIDKFDQIMLDNLLKSGKTRFFVKDNGTINEEEVADWSNTFVHTTGNVGEDSIREFKVSQLDPSIVNYRRDKIVELKEVSNTNEFSRGEAGKGVTAYRAIAVLQEAANKISRDMIDQTYEAFRQMTFMVVENIRQFYDLPRVFRITNDDGVYEFLRFSNKEMQPQFDQTLNTMRKAEFDIKIEAERSDPFSQAASNELMLELYQRGFFNPQMAEQSLMALEMMSFEGKDKIRQKIKDNSQLQQIMMQMKSENYKLRTIVQKLSGRNMGINDKQQPMKGENSNDKGTSVHQQRS